MYIFVIYSLQIMLYIHLYTIYYIYGLQNFYWKHIFSFMNLNSNALNNGLFYFNNNILSLILINKLLN